MKRLRLLLLLITFVFVPATTSAKIDDSHIKSIVQVKIWDTYRTEYIATGSGVFIDELNILTNYHVAEDVIINPNRYLPVVCITNNSLSLPDCKYVFSAYGSWSSFSEKPKAMEELDLALLQFRGIIINGEIKEFLYLPFSDWSDFANHKKISISIYGDQLTGLKVGDQVQTLGYPAEGGNTITYSNGEITNFSVNKYNRVLQIVTSARIGPGSSGGAAFDSYEKFIGVTSGGYLDSNGNFISGVIIPVSTVNWWLQELEGYRINKDDEYTTIDKELEEAIEGALDILDNEKNNIKGSYILPEGALIRATNGIDVYIVKYVGTKKFKRLILSPSVFNNYGHLRWEDVIEVSQATLDSFVTSELVRAVGDDKVYRLYPQGDKGQKRLIKNNSVLSRLGFDPDSIYEINLFDRESYLKGLDLE